jgi:hypothetical protein
VALFVFTSRSGDKEVSEEMEDRQFVEAFESTTLPGDQFPHAAHVRVGWYYLSNYPMLDAMVRFKTGLQRFAAAQGKPERYHETITVAYLLLIAERLGAARGLSWHGFAERHADLLCWTPSILSRYYTDATLWSDRARQVFVLPDRV